jgi:hypothetical protein
MAPVDGRWRAVVAGLPIGERAPSAFGRRSNVEDFIQITTLRGAALDFTSCRFPPDEAPASLHLLMLLGDATGRLSPSGGGGYREHDGQRHWLTLAEVDASALRRIVQRIERSPNYPGWKLDAPEGLSVHDALDVHWGRAQRRWQREQCAGQVDYAGRQEPRLGEAVGAARWGNAARTPGARSRQYCSRWARTRPTSWPSWGTRTRPSRLACTPKFEPPWVRRRLFL